MRTPPFSLQLLRAGARSRLLRSLVVVGPLREHAGLAGKKEKFLASLRELDGELKKEFAKVPADRRLIIASLIRQIRQKKARAPFVENLRHGDMMEHTSRETGVRLGGTLYADSLSVGGGEADTYLKLMKTNGEGIRAALR